MSTTLIALIGKPGSGKGTYGSLLAKRYANVTFLSVGDILRHYAKQNHVLDKKLKSGELVKNKMVNDAVIDSLAYLQEQKLHLLKDDSKKESDSGSLFNDGGEYVILDGYPRSHGQMKLLSTWPRSLVPALAIHIDVPDDIVTTKLLGRRKCSICERSFNVNSVNKDGWYMPPLLPVPRRCKEIRCNWDVDWDMRDDDTAEIINKRLQVFHKETEPVLESWSKMNRLLTFLPYKGLEEMDRLADELEKYFHEHPRT